ncbi:hypothetical protein GA0061075_10828 [Weissella hellenica]|uniref:Uncharacterized protein n=2 Tax=Weissella hellenica TaxID=46256 RepID=A0A7X6LN11_WEIHE|nr:hypothetical protein [Weissella hellenica]SCB95512.1 hypothetical protein GA0061075_10828 [Weissella hellenica]
MQGDSHMSLIDRNRINAIRQANDIPVRELANIGISRNRYYRYLNDENDLPAEGFISLMSHLLLTGTEVNTELVNRLDTVEGLINALQEADKEHDANKIKDISRRGYHLFRNTMARGYLRVASLADVLHAKIIPNEHSQIAKKILIDSFEAVTIWREMDVALLAPVITDLPVQQVADYLTVIWAKKWPHHTMEILNTMSAQFLIMLLNEPERPKDIFVEVTTWMIEQPRDAMGLAWWSNLVNQLVDKNWEAAHEALLVAKQLRMQNMFENGDALTGTWQKRYK